MDVTSPKEFSPKSRVTDGSAAKSLNDFSKMPVNLESKNVKFISDEPNKKRKKRLNREMKKT